MKLLRFFLAIKIFESPDPNPGKTYCCKKFEKFKYKK